MTDNEIDTIWWMAGHMTPWDFRKYMGVVFASIADTVGAKADEEILDIAESITKMDKRTHSFELTQEQLIEIVRLATPPAPSVADAAGASERVSQIATVTKDLIECLMLWNGQASSGLDVNALAGLRDELNAIAKESGNDLE